MTLPFRRRHHDAEAGHDRARALWSDAMVEPIDARDREWLESHLAGCIECRRERDAQLADHSLLRSLRDRPIDAPRDLWARTAAAIERESARSARGGLGLPIGDLVPRQARLPLGVLSGVLVVLVVVAVSIAPNGPVPPVAIATPTAGVPNSTAQVASTPLAVAAAPLTYVQTAPDGSLRIIHANVDEVCPTTKSGCAPLQQETRSSLTLGAEPEALVASPESDQLIVVTGNRGSHAGSVIVVPVPTPVAGQPSAAATSLPPVTPPATIVPRTAPPSSGVSSSPGASASPSPEATPAGAHSIAEGVLLVGEARYSPDGHWLAFSAAPLDGSTGPDLYIWNGTDPSATAVTADHATYFSSWLEDQVLASRLLDGGARPVASSATSASATAGAPVEGPIITERHATSFVLDPVTRAIRDLAKPDVWLPTVDRSGRFVTYWSGTLLTGPSVPGVALGAGRLVLDGWGDAIGTPDTSGAPATPSPARPTVASEIGPAGTPVELAAGSITAFDTLFDPTGTRLAVWVADPSDPTVGTLRLVVLDRAHARVDPAQSPLSSVRALRGLSMEKGRLAWVSPPGQDGKESTVQVLAWSNDQFGQIETVPGGQLTILH